MAYLCNILQLRYVNPKPSEMPEAKVVDFVRALRPDQAKAPMI